MAGLPSALGYWGTQIQIYVLPPVSGEGFVVGILGNHHHLWLYLIFLFFSLASSALTNL